MIALVFGRKKKGSKAGTFLVLVLVVGSVGMTLAGCGGSQTPPAGSNNTAPPVPAQTQTPIPTVPGTSSSDTAGTATPPIILTLPECPIATLTPSPTSTATPTPTPSIKLNKRAETIRDWATALGYSVTEVLATLLQRESYPANWRDPDWFAGGTNDPAEIFKEAATRWFWSWIKDKEVIRIYGMASNDVDREAIAYQWMVNGMESENDWTIDILASQHGTLRPEFVNIANSVLHPSNSEWTKGDGSWGWANAYLYEEKAWEILNQNHRYQFDTGRYAWYIVDAATIGAICKYHTNPKFRC